MKPNETRRIQQPPVKIQVPGQVQFTWIRIDGGQELNASPVLNGLDQSVAAPSTIPATANVGAVDINTGAETVAASGAFPAAGLGWYLLFKSMTFNQKEGFTKFMERIRKRLGLPTRE